MNFIGTGYTKNGETVELVKSAIENGFYAFDCANIYGNESSVGEAISLSGIARNKLILLSKCSFKCMSKEDVIREFNESLANLKTDYLDYYLCHWPNGYERNAVVWECLEELKESGKVKHIGVSNFQIHHINELIKTAKICPEVNQVEIHPFLQQQQLQQYCEKLDIKLMGYGNLAKGFIFDNELAREIAKKVNLSVPKLVNSWLYTRNIHAIIRPMTLEQFEETQMPILLDEIVVKEMEFINTGIRLYSDPDNMLFQR